MGYIQCAVQDIYIACFDSPTMVSSSIWSSLHVWEPFSSSLLVPHKVIMSRLRLSFQPSIKREAAAHALSGCVLV